jgi:uncharacterized DUF497 family protein
MAERDCRQISPKASCSAGGSGASAEQQAKILSRAERGTRRGGRVHGFRQTDAGRYLTVLFIYKKKAKEALILSARDMAKKERKRYEKKR